MGEQVRGYLVLNVIEATGKNKDEEFTWDANSFDAFVKVELRGGSRNIKVSTQRCPVQSGLIQWREQLLMEVLEGANELRIMLCKDKVVSTSAGTKKGTSVIAACGIYVSDIVDAVPIDKYFELFKPAAGGDGGFIRLGLDYKRDLRDVTRTPTPVNGIAAAPAGAHGLRGGGGWLWKALAVVAASAAAVVAGRAVLQRRRKDPEGRQ